MGHHLKKVWKAFKTDFPDDTLKRHDQTISTLDKFEAIRYPDVKLSIGMSGQWCGPAAKVTGHRFKTPKQYAVVVGDIHDLIADVFKALSWNSAAAKVGAPRIDDNGGTRPRTRRKRDYGCGHQTCNMENAHGTAPGELLFAPPRSAYRRRHWNATRRPSEVRLPHATPPPKPTCA